MMESWQKSENSGGEQIRSASGFSVSDEVQALGLRGAYFHILDLCNKESDAEFENLRSEVLNNVLANWSLEKIENDPILQGFRELHEKVGRSGKKYISSPENLLRLVLETHKIPKINLLVDIYNLMSLDTRLALGAHDLSRISGDVHLRLTNGTEGFCPLGYTKAQNVTAGEYAYVDDSNDVLCRLEVRQVEKTKVTLETTNCLFIVQGNTATSDEYIAQATDKLIGLIKRFCGGKEHLLCATRTNEFSQQPA